MKKSRKIRWVGQVGALGKREMNATFMTKKPQEKGPLGRPRHRWKNNIKMDIKEIGCQG
jgi:hypothetical protein